MNRRKGQNGTVVIAENWVRWRLDVEGQEKRINMIDEKGMGFHAFRRFRKT